MMKSTIVNAADVYPCLKMGNHGLVVLFTSSDEGTVVVANKYFDLGEHIDSWDGNSFTLFQSVVTLGNVKPC